MERMKGTKLTQTAGFGAHTSLKKAAELLLASLLR